MGRGVAVLAACIAAIVGLVGAHAMQSATLPSRHLWSGPSGFLGAPVFVTPQVGYIPVSAGAGPGQGGIDITRDGGRHWDRQQPHGLEAGNMSPVSAPEAWAVGCVQHADNCDVLLHTRDMGRTWQVLHPALGTLAPSAAQTTVQVVAGVAPCRAAQLRATAAWQGATGSLAGGITIGNRGPAVCSVSGRPGMVIRGSNGDIARTAGRNADGVDHMDCRGGVGSYWSRPCAGHKPED